MPTVVVTGASQGIGRAIALAYAGHEGTRLALLARNEATLRSVADECARLGAEAEAVRCDVTDEAQIARAAERVHGAFGPADVLVNNAGVFTPGSFLETTPEAFRQQVEVNLTSAFLVTRAFLPAMLERRSGDIVFMASVASLRGYPGGAAYGAAKHGLLGLARTLREETKEQGVRVIAVMPGATLTPSWEGVDLPPDRLMPPEAIAQTVVAATSLPRTAVVEEILIRPQLGDL
ncbi:MAG: SDR family oxidoreductase [Bacteroidota bacterium]